MRHLREAVGLKRPERWQNNDWILHVDNAQPHTDHVVLQFLAKNSTISPDLAPNDFFLYPKLKMKLKGNNFDNVDMIQAESKATLRNLSKTQLAEISPTKTAVTIASDCRSALAAICSSGPTPTSLVANIIKVINRAPYIRLCWVPGHTGINGNEQADGASKIAATSVLPHSYSTLPRTHARNLTRKFLYHHGLYYIPKTIRHQIPKENCCHSKTFPQISTKNPPCRGHHHHPHGPWSCMADITRVHPETDPTCIHCSEEPQTVDHLLFSCPAFLRHRRQTAILLGLTHLNPRSMASLPDSTSAWKFLINWFNSAIKTGREKKRLSLVHTSELDSPERTYPASPGFYPSKGLSNESLDKVNIFSRRVIALDMNPAKKKKKAYKPTTRIVNVADLEREDEMVISRNCSILSSIGHPALKSLHEDLIRYIASRTKMIKALATNVENLTDTLESFAELDEIEEANKPKTACRGTQTCPAPSCNETSSQTDPIKPATPAPAALPAKKPASSLPAPAPTKRKQSEAPNPPAKRTNLNGPSKPVPSHVSKPAAAQVILHGEKSAAHTVVISDDPQADPREMLKTGRAAHTLPQGVWASLRTKGKLVLHSSNPDTIPEVTTSLASKLNGMKVRQQKEILPRICLFKVDEETSNSTIEETFLETAAVRKLPGDKVVRVAHRSAPRNGTCTAFIEVDLKTFRALGVRGRIVVDGVILNFEESIRARVCFRCCGFGHNSAQCTRAPKCFHCGEDGHEGRTCPSIADQRTSKCANCCSQGLPDKHEARASSCPILKSRALKF
ncbi:hypothetical protein LAZ67_15001142 [Cordylochernes scorpioides]|uniref:Gag-like protein n=1 Tax=Cordylochernes scorpioides TaxID=51811 RepID=A0ABY6LC30_9ARAC|nr:hypothetical protein LAZ67_15001142 [Cordylochernes scorpioides]